MVGKQTDMEQMGTKEDSVVVETKGVVVIDHEFNE